MEKINLCKIAKIKEHKLKSHSKIIKANAKHAFQSNKKRNANIKPPKVDSFEET